MCPAVRSIRPEYGHLLLEVRHLELKKYNRSSIKGDENGKFLFGAYVIFQ